MNEDWKDTPLYLLEYSVVNIVNIVNIVNVAVVVVFPIASGYTKGRG